ncbi:MAG: acyl carrier protein [Planctomycetes bacterium]|nr:acyl carrier protein [Planctomycetota bacterium]
MDMKKIDEIVTNVFQTVFHQPELELHDDLTSKDVAGWDSLNHVSLLIRLENELGIKFQSYEVVQLTNVGDLRSLIHEKLARQPAG